MTKKELTLLNNYKRAYTTQLQELYANASTSKWQAYFRILEEARNNNGYNVKCFNANTCTYSMAYLTQENGKEYLNYHTAYNFYKFCIND